MTPKKSGLPILEAIRDLDTRVIFLTGSKQRDIIYRAIRGGAAGYMLKTADWDDLIAAIKTVAKGGTVIAPEMMEAFFSQQIRERAVG